jgi:pimeloyl-ACP methyl ester carboxylesterase
MTRHRAAISACLIGILLSVSSIHATGFIDGQWQGAIDRDGSIQIVEIDFKSHGDTLGGTYAIPDLNIYEEPLTETAQTDSTVQFHLLYGVFSMIRHDDIGELTGGNDKWNPPVKLHLKKKSFADPPFFTREDLSIKNDRVTIAATLYKPVGGGPFPVAVIIPGSGEQSRAMWEYRSHVYGLVRRGIAALIYDKRGVGQSSGSLATADFKDLARDALIAVDSLRERSDIDTNKIGLYGISQGGWIAAVAGRKSKKLAFVVFMEGPAVSTWEQELNGVEYTMRAEGYSPAAIDSALEYTRLYFDAVESRKKWKKLVPWLAKVEKSKWAEYVQKPLRQDDVDMVWWKVNEYDPANDLSGLHSSALAIFGADDTRVPPVANIEKMKAYLAKAEIKYSVVVVPGLGHASATSQTLKGGKWDWPKSYWVWSKRPGMIDDSAAAWILGNSK